MIKVAVIGSGNGGSAPLDIFHTNGNVKIIGITYKDRDAPGLNLLFPYKLFYKLADIYIKRKYFLLQL